MPSSVLVMPKLLCNAIYVEGLAQPLNAIADVLDEQDRSEYARAIRASLSIVDYYTKVVLNKTHEGVLT